jgi:GntR family transcriptional regulator
MLKIDHGSPIPLRVQVEQLLRKVIQRPEYRSGNQLLPEETTLAAKLGVSRGTVRSGISKLVFEGLLVRKAGVGTRIINRQVESGVSAWRSFTREMAKKGIKVRDFQHDLTQITATPEVAKALRLQPDTKVWRLSRVRGWDDWPVLQSISWFHPRLRLKGDEDFSQPLYEVIESMTGATPHHAHEEFIAIVADAPLARMLNISAKSPLLLRRHTVFDAGNRPFEYAEVRYVSSRFALSLDLKRG